MTDRPPPPDGDLEIDAELERRLRAAFAGAAVPEAPDAVHAEASRLAATPDVRVRARPGGWRAPGWIAVVLAVTAILVGSLFSGGSSPAPTEPSRPATSAQATEHLLSPSASSQGSATCDVSPGAVHGTWWREIGGPNAYFNWEEGQPRPAGSSWKLFVRFDPDAGPDEEVSVWAGQLGSGVRAYGQFNSRMEPSNIYHFDSPAPDLPGGWYLFEQPLPTAGCWRLTAAIAGRVVGTATVEIGPASSTSAPPTNAPTPEVEPTPWPVQSMVPAPDDVLPLAGRDGEPGRLRCSNRPFGFDGLMAPTGAEHRVGPEYDLLRSLSRGPMDMSWAPPGQDPTFREAARDPTGVVFLNDRDAPEPIEGGPYAYITLKLGPSGWAFEGSGDCQPRGVPGPDFGQATWTLDPSFAAPVPETRTLHLLVQELACSGGRSASGRISPAFVIESRHEVAIELFIQGLPVEGDCPASPSTPATLRLPTPIGDRTLLDVGAMGLGGSGG